MSRARFDAASRVRNERTNERTKNRNVSNFRTIVMQLIVLLVAFAATALAIPRFDRSKYDRQDDMDDADPMAKLRERMGE